MKNRGTVEAEFRSDRKRFVKEEIWIPPDVQGIADKTGSEGDGMIPAINWPRP